jgi:hypothetical protein
MQIDQNAPNSKILTEAKHMMTREEEQVKYDICALLLRNNHRKYAERLADSNLALNLVDSTKDPKFVAAISFEDATVYVSDAFLKGGPGIFKQLDVVMRHELAHNLMMHQIRMMHVFKELHANDDPEAAYEQIKYSWNLHTLLNWLEDFEISNERYTTADKQIARNLELNGRVINGLVTEDHRGGWVDLPLEQMYDQLTAELEQINDKIRNDPNWQPVNSTTGKVDGLARETASMIAGYYDPDSYSSLAAYSENGLTLENIRDNSGDFKKFPEIVKKIAKAFYDAFKDYGQDDDQIAKVKAVLSKIATSAPNEKVVITNPDTGDTVGALYTADFKALVSDILKKIIEKPVQLSQAFVDAWTKVMEIVAPENLSNDALDSVISELGGIDTMMM